MLHLRIKPKEMSWFWHITRPLKTTSVRTVSTQDRQLYDRIIRVDHAGELGADRIYAGKRKYQVNCMCTRVLKDDR